MNITRVPDPRHLDVAALALAAGRLSGEWPLTDLHRLQQDALPLLPDSPAHRVDWAARGEQRSAGAVQTEVWLHVQAQTALGLTCQRCLRPMTVALDVRTGFRFVHGEERAESLDEHSEEDVLALTPFLDLLALIEDELILSLPLVPRHDVCPQAFPMSTGAAPNGDIEPEEHPFAALASLRGRDAGGG